jgi:hypothetical protein
MSTNQRNTSEKLYNVEITTVVYVWAKSEKQAERVALHGEFSPSREGVVSSDVVVCEVQSDVVLHEDIKDVYVCYPGWEDKTVGSCLEEMKKSETTNLREYESLKNA